MLKVTRTPTVQQDESRHNGLAAYEAWATHLLLDGAFPVDDEAVLRQRYEVHNDAVSTVAEARWYGSVFLAEIAEQFAAGPHTPGTTAHVLHAAACYAAEHDLMWQIWDLAGGIGNPEAFRALLDPDLRRAMAEVILRARDLDRSAAHHLEQALT
jgi:hypothetical protein